MADDTATPIARRFAIAWIAVVVIASLVAAQRDGALAHHLALAPARIWRGEVWRLATWGFVWDRPVELGICCLGLYRFGPGLVTKWGAARFTVAVTCIFVATGVVASLLGLVVPSVWKLEHVGGFAVSWLVVILHARSFPTFNYYPNLAEGIQIRAHHVIFLALGLSLLGLAFGFPRYLQQLVAVGISAIFPIPS